MEIAFEHESNIWKANGDALMLVVFVDIGLNFFHIECIEAEDGRPLTFSDLPAQDKRRIFDQIQFQIIEHASELRRAHEDSKIDRAYDEWADRSIR